MLSSDILTCWQVFIKQEYDFIVEAHPKVIIDAGANIGLASIYFANKYLPYYCQHLRLPARIA
jgi:cephalosporin hydroxylase